MSHDGFEYRFLKSYVISQTLKSQGIRRRLVILVANFVCFIAEPRLDKNPFGNGFGPPGGPPGLNPMAAQFMALQHPAFLSAAQVSAAGLPPFGLPSPSIATSSPSIPGRPEPQFVPKGPNAAGLASLEALQR